MNLKSDENKKEILREYVLFLIRLKFEKELGKKMILIYQSTP